MLTSEAFRLASTHLNAFPFKADGAARSTSVASLHHFLPFSCPTVLLSEWNRVCTANPAHDPGHLWLDELCTQLRFPDDFFLPDDVFLRRKASKTYLVFRNACKSEVRAQDSDSQSPYKNLRSKLWFLLLPLTNSISPFHQSVIKVPKVFSGMDI